MGSFIIEIQNDVIVTPIQHFTETETVNGTAKSAWYSVCAYAAVSSIPRHVVMLMAEDGHEIKKEIFIHPAT